MVLGTACLVPIAVFNGRFVSLWVGGDQFAGQVVTTLAVTNAMLMAVVQLWGALFNGTGNASRMVVVATVGATLNLLISVLLTRFGLGLAGPLVGTLAVFLLIHSWAVPRLLRRHFDVDVTHLIWAVARPLIVAAPYALLLWLVGRHLPPLGWISLAAAMAVAAAGQLALSWIFVFPSSQRRMWIGRVRHVIGR
jgi:O-antigen/teichoic acid export membrane protein